MSRKMILMSDVLDRHEADTGKDGHNGEELPKLDVPASAKSQLDKLRKTEAEKFDKALLKALDKEAKKSAQVFEAADKTVQDPELKTIITSWLPRLKNYAAEVAAAETEASKRK